VFEDRDRAGAGRDLGVGAQYREAGVLAVELLERLCIVAVGTILSRSRDESFFSTVASRVAKRASGPLASPTAKTSVSELRSQTRPAHTVAAVRIRVRIENSRICVLLLLTTRERRNGIPGCGVGASALMAHTRGQGRSATKPAPQGVSIRKCLEKNDNFV